MILHRFKVLQFKRCNKRSDNFGIAAEIERFGCLGRGVPTASNEHGLDRQCLQERQGCRALQCGIYDGRFVNRPYGVGAMVRSVLSG